MKNVSKDWFYGRPEIYIIMLFSVINIFCFKSQDYTLAQGEMSTCMRHLNNVRWMMAIFSN